MTAARAPVAAPPVAARATAGSSSTTSSSDAPAGAGTRRLLEALSVLFVTAAVAVAGMAFAGAVVVDEVVVTVLPAAVLSAVIVLACAGLRRDGRVAAVAGELVAAFVALLVGVAVLMGAMSGSGAAGSGPEISLREGLVDGWGTLLSRSVPVSGEPVALAPIFVMVFVAGWVGAEVAVRRRGALLPMLAPVALVVAARLFGPLPPTTPPVDSALPTGSLLIGAGLVVLAGLEGAWRAGGDPRVGRSRVGSMLAVLPVAAVAVVAGVLVALVLPARPAASLRSVVDQTVEPASTLDPLTELAATGTIDADAAALTVELDAAAGLDGLGEVRLAGAVLDTYDGIGWTTTATFRRTGEQLPAATEPPAPADTVAVTYRVTPGALTGPWLPLADRPSRLAFDQPFDVAVDEVSGVVVAADGDAATAPAYRATSEVGVVRGETLRTAGLPSDPALARYLALPSGTPEEFAAAATEAMGRARSPFEQLVALESWLVTNAEADLAAPGGSSYGMLARFLDPAAFATSTSGSDDDGVGGEGAGGDGAGGTDPEARVVRIGTPEQFASAFAVLGRLQGFPTRLVIGWRVPAVAGEEMTMARADTAVWPEVYLDGLGWIAFDPQPRGGGEAPADQPESVQEVAAEKSRALEDQASDDSGVPAPANPIVEAEAAVEDGPAPWAVLVGLAVVAVLAVLGWLVGRAVATRARRRRRRNRGDARERIEGAWYEACERLEARGLGSLDSATVSEVIDRAHERWGEPVSSPLAQLGGMVNDAAFAPDPPPEAWVPEAWDRLAAAERAVPRR